MDRHPITQRARRITDARTKRAAHSTPDRHCGGLHRMSKDRPYIEINTAAGNKQLILGREPISIGRHSENKLVVADNMASRFHCVIEKAPDGYLLRDLGASNGTFVNGRKVKSALLQPGDVVRVGNTELVLVLPDADANPPPLTDL